MTSLTAWHRTVLIVMAIVVVTLAALVLLCSGPTNQPSMSDQATVVDAKRGIYALRFNGHLYLINTRGGIVRAE